MHVRMGSWNVTIRGIIMFTQYCTARREYLKRIMVLVYAFFWLKT